MTEWDALADYLEQSGHPEWAEMARDAGRGAVVLPEATGAAIVDGGIAIGSLVELVWADPASGAHLRIIGLGRLAGGDDAARRIGVEIPLPGGGAIRTTVHDTRGITDRERDRLGDFNALVVYPPDRVEAHRRMMAEMRAAAPSGRDASPSRP